MRFAACLLAISAALFAAALVHSEEPQKPAAPAAPPKVDAFGYVEHHYKAHCRWIGNARDESFIFPTATVTDGKRETFSNISQKSFITGIWRRTYPNAWRPDQGDCWSNLDDGVTIELTVSGWPPEGVTIDATVEQSKVGDVATKEVIPGSLYFEKTTVEIPKVEIVKKRIIDFVKFGAPFVVPLGEKRADGRVPRVEIVIDELKD